jgi:hypothetical protein
MTACRRDTNIIGPLHEDTACLYSYSIFLIQQRVYAHKRDCLADHAAPGAPRYSRTARSSPAKTTWTVETDVLDQTARVAKEVGDGAAPSLPSDPGPRANVTRDFKPDINT